MTTHNHSALPWRTSGHKDCFVSCDIRNPIAQCFSPDFMEAFSEGGEMCANAAFIVHAANHHYQLVEALDNMIDDYVETSKLLNAEFTKARAVLDAAKEMK